MKVLIACEESGTVRDEFIKLGHNAISCDLKSSRRPGPHIQGDAILAAYSQPWDMIIAHCECTFMANSGAKHLYAGMNKRNGPNVDRWAMLGAAATFFLTLWNAPIEKKAFENPIMLGHVNRLFPEFPRPTQVIQPWQFGHGETKATCLWLSGCPPLTPTNIVEGREQKVFKMAPGPNRKRDRSVTYQGIAAAMAMQWGGRVEP